MFTDYSNIGPSDAFENINASLRIVHTSNTYTRNAIQDKYLEIFPKLYTPQLTLKTTEPPDNYIISDIDGYIPNIPNGTIFDHLSFYPLDWPDFHRIPTGGNVGPDNSLDIRQNPVTRLYSSKKEDHLINNSTSFKSLEEQNAIDLQRRKERINNPPVGYNGVEPQNNLNSFENDDKNTPDDTIDQLIQFLASKNDTITEAKRNPVNDNVLDLGT